MFRLTAATIAATNPAQAFELALEHAELRLSATRQNDFPALRRELPHFEEMHTRAKNLMRVGDHPVLLAFCNNLANAYCGVGRYDDAIALHQDTLRVRERVLGLEHPDTLSSRNNLAKAYGDAGRYEDAILLDEKTLGMQNAIAIFEVTLNGYEKILGSDNPDTLKTRNNLAYAYSVAGRYEEAIPLYQEILGLMERVLGPEHPHSVGSRNNLAIAYHAVGRDSEAEALVNSR